MVDFYPVHVPEGSTPGQCLATFSTTLTSMSIEIGMYLNNRMSAKWGASWFEQLREARIPFDDKYNQYKSFYDFSWIANEAIKHSDSPIREFLPKNEYQFYKELGNLRSARNRWYHDYNPHNISELRGTLNCVKYIAEKCGLSLAEELLPVIRRVNEISSGTFAVPSPQVETAGNSSPEQLPSMQQVAVGAAWLGPRGLRKIELTRSGSLIDLEAGANVTAELGDSNLNRYLKLWRKLELDWLWVDPLGSVAANVQGSLRMVGYWGQNVDDSGQDPFAKFLLKNSYAFVGDVFYEREGNQALDESNIGEVTASTLRRGLESVQEGEILRVTWDGDLIYFGDRGPEYIGEVESDDWFPGHFLVATESQ